MISGPVFPRNQNGLRELMKRHLGEIERGLDLVEQDLELEAGFVIDALGCDAANRPVFLFAVDRDGERDAPMRVLSTRGWLNANTPLLRRLLPDSGIDFEQTPRFVVVTFEVSDALAKQVRDCAPGCEIYEIQCVRIGGRARVGAMPRLGAASPDVEDSFALPSGVERAVDRTVCVRFMDLLKRIEPDLDIRGDRYSRHFRFAGESLAELEVQGAGVVVRAVVDREGATREIPLTSVDDCVEAVDCVMRHYLTVAAEQDIAPTTTTEPAESHEPKTNGNGHGNGHGSSSSLARTESSEESPVSLQSLRETVEQSQLTPEEYTALGELAPDDD